MNDATEKPDWGTRLLLAAFVLASACMLILIGLSFVVPRVVDRVVETYTDAQPLEIVPVALEKTEKSALDERVERFSDAIEEGRSVDPLVLEEEELNALLQDGIDRTDGLFEVNVLPGQLHVRASIPIDETIPLGPWSRDVSGRYLNGVAVLDVEFIDGELQLRLADFKVGQRSLPGYVVRRLGDAIERAGYLDTPDVRDYLAKVDSIEVLDGEIVLTAPPEPASSR